MEEVTDKHRPGSYELDAAQLRERADAKLRATPSQSAIDPATGRCVGRGDFDLNPHVDEELAAIEQVAAAAVLVPIVMRETLTVLLTQRSSHLRRHAGQIAFPGGRMDDTDSSPLGTALREAEEEIGLCAAHVEPVGYLDSYRTGTGFDITPVVALISPDHDLRLDPSEVEFVFEVPFEFVMDPANLRTDKRIWRGRERRYYAIPYNEHYIWGATAGMLRNLRERLFVR